MSDIYSSISNKFFRRSGRLNRLKHLILQLALIGADMAFFVLLFILAVILSLLLPDYIYKEYIVNILVALYLIEALLIGISRFLLMIRRLHDLNGSGFFCLQNFVPLVNISLGLYLFLKKETEGDNDYGSDPLDMTEYVYGETEPAVPEHNDNPYARTDTAPKE